jgi:hypothetical protein
MLNHLCRVETTDGEELTGRFELRGVYGPAYCFVLVTETGHREISWSKARSITITGEESGSGQRSVRSVPPSQVCDPR